MRTGTEGVAVHLPTAMPLRAIVVSLLILSYSAAGVRAQPAPAYDAALGTLPQAQGWTLFEDIQPAISYPLAVAAGDLHLSTLGFGNNVPADNGGGVWWQRSDVTLDFATDFTIEVTVRIQSAPNHSVNGDAGFPRPGYALAAYDVNGHFFWIGLGTSEVFFSNTAFGHYGTGNTVTTAFNTTDAHHTYRIERAPGGVGAALRIDGVKRLELPTLGPVENSGALVYFGDPTYWANSESFTSSVRISGATLGADASPQRELLSAHPLGSPARRLGVAFRSQAAGMLALDVFDVTGRRVGSLQREVAAGQDGSFEAPGTHADGLYYYRLSLAARTGGVSSVAGRIVLIR